MPRDDPALFAAPRRPRGRGERAVDAAARAARSAGDLPATSAPLVTAARQLARGLDVAEAAGKVYALPQLARELRETCAALRWVSTDTGEVDELAAWLSGLDTAEVSHPADT